MQLRAIETFSVQTPDGEIEVAEGDAIDPEHPAYDYGKAKGFCVETSPPAPEKPRRLRDKSPMYAKMSDEEYRDAVISAYGLQNAHVVVINKAFDVKEGHDHFAGSVGDIFAEYQGAAQYAIEKGFGTLREIDDVIDQL